MASQFAKKFMIDGGKGVSLAKGPVGIIGMILLAYGGHGFEMLESTEIIEVKQGPYAGDHDKTRFDPIPADQVKLKSDTP